METWVGLGGDVGWGGGSLTSEGEMGPHSHCEDPAAGVITFQLCGCPVQLPALSHSSLTLSEHRKVSSVEGGKPGLTGKSPGQPQQTLEG